jgi:hypothetical protein
MSKLSEHALNVFVVDRNGTPIRNATVQAVVKGELVAEATTKGTVDSPVRLQFSGGIDSIELKAIVNGIEKKVTVDAEAGGYRFDFKEVSVPLPVDWEKVVAVIFGVVFVATMLIIAVEFPNPTPFQYTTFRIVLALACAGVASVIPGVLNVNIGTWLRAGGALAVFAVVYFKSPASLVVAKPADPRPTDPFTIYLVYPHNGQLAEASYRFPYSDIQKNGGDFRHLMALIGKLPDQQYRMPADSIIFRVADERVVNEVNKLDVRSDGNTSVIVAPPDAVSQFADPHLFFTFVHGMLPRRAAPN